MSGGGGGSSALTSVAPPDGVNNPFTTPGTGGGFFGASTPPPTQRGNPFTAGGPGRTYFQQNPDVGAAYAQNSMGMSPTDFAQQHYQQYGQYENRSDPSQQFYQPVYQPQYQNYAMTNPMGVSQYGQGFGGYGGGIGGGGYSGRFGGGFMPPMQTPFSQPQQAQMPPYAAMGIGMANRAPRTEADWNMYQQMVSYAPGTDMAAEKARFMAPSSQGIGIGSMMGQQLPPDAMQFLAQARQPKTEQGWKEFAARAYFAPGTDMEAEKARFMAGAGSAPMGMGSQGPYSPGMQSPSDMGDDFIGRPRQGQVDSFANTMGSLFGMPTARGNFGSMGASYPNSFQTPFSYPQQPQTNYGPAQQIVSRSAAARGTPNVMRRAEGGIASLVGDE